MIRITALLVLLSVLPSTALAQGVGVTGIGPRVGFSTSPDQLVVGGHAVIGEIAPRMTFDPSLELGFGDNITVISMNLDLHYHFTLRDSDWQPYAGAGVGIHVEEEDRRAPLEDRSNTGVGGSLLFGAGVPTRSGNRFFGEVKFGLGDGPSLKLMVGWNFKT